jgi:hypothetical protein
MRGMLSTAVTCTDILVSFMQLPTSVTWDDQGHVIVTEKAGVLKIFNGWVGNGGTVLLDIQDLVASYGDHG